MMIDITAASRSNGRALWGRSLSVAVAAAVLLIGSVAAAHAAGWRMAALWATGAALGAVLYRSSFGFAGGFRGLLRAGATAQFRGQLLLIGLLVVLMMPAVHMGSVFGQPVRGFVFPIGTELVIGAFLFGVGMQIGGGCASGTLYTVGGGSTRMVITLVFAIVGATLAAWTHETWSGLPRLPAVSMPEAVGLVPAVMLHVAVIGALWVGAIAWERRHTGTVAGLRSRANEAAWSYTTGAVVLAALCLLTLVLAGRPWAITQAFALWGSWGVEALRIDDPAFWPFWEDPTRVDALHRRLFTDVMSVMDLGLIAGAATAAVAAGKFAPVWRIPLGALAGSVAGGLLLGVGAILATGCNISAYVSGIASGSLHGWIWVLAALPGNWVGLKLRPLFGLDEPTPRS